MTDTQMCPECEMEFDWPGVEADGEVYCCEPCSIGEPCTCPQHQHSVMTASQRMTDTRAPATTPE